MTKRQGAALERERAWRVWNRAIHEGRAVKFEAGFNAYISPAAAQKAIAIARADGREAELVDPGLALKEYLQEMDS